MRTLYKCENRFGRFIIENFEDGSYYVSGNIDAAAYAFKSINRRPPNEYGNFYGREKAGNLACAELIQIVEGGGSEFIRGSRI